jgi:hypothetical protein
MAIQHQFGGILLFVDMGESETAPKRIAPGLRRILPGFGRGSLFDAHLGAQTASRIF